MTTLAFVVIVAAGYWAYRILDFSDEVDEGRVRSDGIWRTDAATRARLRREQ